MEYLHRSDPGSETSQGFERIEVAENFLTLSYKRLIGPSENCALTLESSRDLSEWTTTNHQERSLGIVDGIETVEARIPIWSNRPGFLRFHYRQ